MKNRTTPLQPQPIRRLYSNTRLRMGAIATASLLLVSCGGSSSESITITIPITPTATPQPTATATPQPTTTATPQPTATATPQPTATATPQPTATATPQPTATATPQPTTTATPQPTTTATPQPTTTATPQPTTTATPQPTATATPQPTATATPQPTATATPQPTATATPQPTATATPQPTATATPQPTATATPQPTATATPQPTATATPQPTATATPQPTATATPQPTATATPQPTATATPQPTATATPQPTATATPQPTATATPQPTATATPQPTATATPQPTATATPIPTAAPIYATEANIANCQPSVLSQSEKDKVVNYFNDIRSLHGLPPVVYDSGSDTMVSQSALMSVANGQISHSPSTSWSCYSQDGYTGSEKSNLYISYQSGTSSTVQTTNVLDSLLMDNNVQSLGHRRWMLHPFLKFTALGRAEGTPNTGSNTSFYATAVSHRVIFDQEHADIGSYNIDYVAYPYKDYPSRLVNKDWFLSFSAISDNASRYNNQSVDYSAATVQVLNTTTGTAMTVSDVSYNNDWYGNPNHLQWKTAGLQDNVRYDVTIQNVTVNGTSKNYSYYFKLE